MRLLEGPGRALESLHARFMVDLVLGIDNPRQHALAPRQQQFRERLMNEIVVQTQLRPWSAAGLFSDNPAMRLGLGLADKLASQFDPGQLALTRMSDYLLILQSKSHASVELRQQFGLIGEQFSLRAGHKQRALTQRGLVMQSGLHSDDVFTRWHAYHQWLVSPALVGLMGHKEMLAWMGSSCDAVRQPVCWSVTQTWQPVALGMPRLCSATRLVDAMVEELFLNEA